jgi:predicted Zn-dependent protease
MTNAMALPGGYIYITRGMLNLLETEDQLAAVLAHETAHVTARHSAALMSQQIGIDMLLSAVTTESTASAVQVARIGSQIIGLKYSRDYEKQADEIGMEYLVKAGYSPYAMVDVMRKLNEQSGSRPIEFLSTHPNPDNRLELLRDKIARENYPAIKRTPADEYKKNVLDRMPPAPEKTAAK